MQANLTIPAATIDGIRVGHAQIRAAIEALRPQLRARTRCWFCGRPLVATADGMGCPECDR